jgi:hypothetical protein
MRSLFAALAVTAFLSGQALAQTPPSQPGGDDHGDTRPAPASEEHDGDWDHGGMRPHRPMPHSRAAGIRIETGDLSIGVRCPEDENMKACADFTLQLLDKVSNLPRH